MKTLTTFAIVLPGMALAHGGHPPVAEAAHSGLHGMITAGLAVALIVLGTGLWRARQ